MWQKKMKEQIARAAQKFINLEIVGLAFLLPLFFLPVTPEFFEFNKLTLLTVATLLGLAAWGLKAALTGDLGVRSSSFDLPVLALWVVAATSTIFSDSKLVSLLGQYSRWHPSLISATVLTLFYFLVSWNLTTRMRNWAIYGLLTSSALAGLLYIPQYFGVNILGQNWSQQATFTPLGSPTVLALFLGAVSGFSMRRILNTQTVGLKVLFSALWVVLVATLALINSPVGWVAFGVSTAVGILTSPAELLGKGKWYTISAIVVAGAFAAIVLMPPIFGKSTFLNRDLPIEVSLDLQTSWSVSATSFRQKPFWGSGLSIFLADFTRYKPLRFNQTQFWTLRFEKPLSEYLRAFAEEGILGVLAWLLLIGTVTRSLIRNEQERSLMPIATAVLAAFLITHATVVSSFLLFLALAATNPSPPEPKPASQGEGSNWTIGLFLVILIGVIFGLTWTYRTYAAEAYQRRALTTDDARESYNLQNQAIQNFPWRAEYRLALARTSFIIANQLAGAENPTEEDQENIRTLVAQSISESRSATDLYPLNVGNWESLAQIYRSLIGLAQEAEQWAADSYQRAVSLDLFNPLLRVSFGGLYYQLGQYEQAVDQFRAAVNLKPDYANAHYNLGRAYKELGKKDLAIQELELALKLTNPEAEGYEEAKQILDDLKK